MRLTFELPSELKLEFHQRCIAQQKDMSSELRSMVENWLKANPGNPKQKMRLALE